MSKVNGEGRWRTVISHWSLGKSVEGLSLVIAWLNGCIDEWGDVIMEYWVLKFGVLNPPFKKNEDLLHVSRLRAAVL